MRALPPTLFALLMAACSSDPCDRYVDYMCTCHDEDGTSDCSDLHTIYNEADADLQDECLLELERQKDEDEANGTGCNEESSTDTGA